MAKKTKAKSKVDYPYKSVNNLLDKFSSFKNLKSSKKVWIVVLILGLLLLAFYKKSWFVAAIVNGMPITNLELQLKLNEQFRTQTLNQLINEKIILGEARKTNSIPQGPEIDKRVLELETQVGGAEMLNTLLAQQGQNRKSLKDQVRLQLTITKLYEKEASVSAEEVAKFIEQNSSALQATDSAKQKEEAFNILKQQKITEVFNNKFQELRQNAKIQIF
ncbi:MAG: hypothetical protein AAB414_01015 [Patescibacteria group bacterium]